MKQSLFEQQHAALWAKIEMLLADKPQGDRKELPRLYRALCQTLSLARQRGYSPSLTEHLHTLALAAHRQLYGAAIERPAVLRHWLTSRFPRLVREEWRLFLIASLIFWGAGLAVGLLVWFYPEWAYSWVSPQELAKYKRMYSQAAARLGREGSGSDLMMFGFYIWNNVSIGFRTFAGGILGGVPALLSLAFNGLHGGVIASWLSRDPVTREAFWSFVITHGAFEITGLILSAVAGMRLGLSLISPGRYSRHHSLLRTAQRMLPMVVGAALLTALAAFFEAFWSAMPGLAPAIKYAVGGGAWLLVLAYFTLAGRHEA
ncbi:Uncharacterized membrane protein SpoIIM, required for sporulation [Formivibrio citricus]|uniref:Uncharacterized membrane protein SpoIIM, required for sporulation n=1 Tax=Formivibrio citricus TaxID=83765 RepID=A0A1I4ZBV6_9NEIS|nr:stage II sporulation protein M [Formivibrio citricus]SFN47754.1 Uncharacterized membrane protein SpoIIM, required for sporulation [Formivibrio citricus]